MTKPPDAGVYGIKLIMPAHLKYAHHYGVFDGSNGKHAVMNFRDSIPGRSRAYGIPIGHRALVYVSDWQKFIWAIEFIGPVDVENRILAAHGDPPHASAPINRPIRFLARVDPPANGPSREAVLARAKFDWRSYGNGHEYISFETYRCLYDAICWTWSQ